MHSQFAEYFVDPETRQPLIIEVFKVKGESIESGVFRDESGTREYPIVRGIPRFADFEQDNYSRSFGYQWHKWPRVQFESENIGKPMEGHTREMWERIVGFEQRNLDLTGQTVVDIGCGAGRFIEVARSKGAKVIGLDYSSAVEVAASNFHDDPDVCICQGDALKLPLGYNIDGAYSIGVLHHTPDPESGIREAHRILTDDGWFSVCVYGKGGYYDFPSVQLWRRFFKILWPVFRHYPPLFYTYFTNYFFRPIAQVVPPLGKAIRVLFPFVKLPDINWSLLDTFDSVTPSNQTAHESFEVFKWLKNADFSQIEPTNWGFTSYTASVKSDKSVKAAVHSI